MDQRHRSIVDHVADKAYRDFKKYFPDEEPFIKVICTRKVNFNRPEYNKPWRRTIFDEKGESTMLVQPEQVLEKKITTINQIDLTKPKPKQLKGTSQTRQRIIDENKVIEKNRTKLVETTTTTSVVDTSSFDIETILDLKDKPYQANIFIRSSDIVTTCNVMVDSLPENFVMVTSNHLSRFNDSDIIDMYMRCYNEWKKLSLKLQELSSKIQETKNMISQETQTDTIKKPVGKLLWKLLKALYQVKRLTPNMKMIKKLKSLAVHYKNMNEFYRQESDLKLIREIDSLKVRLEETTSDASEYKKLSVKVKQSIAGNKSVKDICESYFNLQKKLNEIKSRLTGKIKAHYGHIEWEDTLKEVGFVGGLEKVILYLMEEHDELDDEC